MLDFSSEAADEDDEYDDWGAKQAIGAPKVTGYGDSGNAWAPFGPCCLAFAFSLLSLSAETNGGHEWLTVQFRQRVIPREVLILESWNPGAITKVEVKDDETGVFFAIYTAEPRELPHELRIVKAVPKKLLTFPCNTVKIHLDTAKVYDEWNEIAAIQLAGLPIEGDEPVLLH